MPSLALRISIFSSMYTRTKPLFVAGDGRNTIGKTFHCHVNENNVIVAVQQNVCLQSKNMATSWNIGSSSFFTCGIETNKSTLNKLPLAARFTNMSRRLGC